MLQWGATKSGKKGHILGDLIDQERGWYNSLCDGPHSLWRIEEPKPENKCKRCIAINEKVNGVKQSMLKDELIRELSQFHGTSRYYKHWLGGLYTDGVAYLAEKAECHWLLDAIFSHQVAEIKKIHFQLWTLKVNDNHSAVLTMQEDLDEPRLVKQVIEYTDFPLREIKLYLIDEVLSTPLHKVLLLPGEY